MVIFELPSGYFADIVGRRKTMILAAAACLVAICVYSQGRHFYHFLVAEMCFALGMSLISGADAAMIYDTLQAMGKENEFQKIFGNLFFFNLFSFGVSCIAGGWIGEINFRWTFYATMPFFVGAILVAMSMKEPPRKKLQAEAGWFKELISILTYCFVENKRLRLLMIYSGLILGLNNAALWFYQPYFQVSGLPIAWFGVAFASYQVFTAVSSKAAHVIEKRLGEKVSLIILVFFVGTGYFLMGHFVYIFSFAFAFFHQFARGFSRIVLTDYVNRLTDSDRRATVLSAQNLIMRLFYALLIPFAGKIADLTGIVDALNILGMATVVIGGIMLVIMRRAKMV
jgi:MFS family permease